MPYTESRTSFWRELTPTENLALQRIGTSRRFVRGDVVFREDDPATHVMILRSGYLKVSRHNNHGFEFVLAFRGPGDIVGERAGFDLVSRSATVCALGRVDALVVPAGRFAAFLATNPNASRALHRVLARRLVEADLSRVASGASTVAQQVAALLLRLTELYGERAPDGGVQLGLPLSQEDLAGCLGVSRRAVARAMENWRSRGLVLTGRRKVVVRDAAALRRIAGEVGTAPAP
jgi:CRP/FNR family transcriptional regulator, cyclic AMP receptor protein